MGVPVLLGLKGEAAKIVSDSGSGVVFEPENPELLAQQVLLLSQNKQMLDQMSKAAVDTAKRYRRSDLAALMLKGIEDCLLEK